MISPFGRNDNTQPFRMMNWEFWIPTLLGGGALIWKVAEVAQRRKSDVKLHVSKSSYDLEVQTLRELWSTVSDLHGQYMEYHRLLEGVFVGCGMEREAFLRINPDFSGIKIPVSDGLKKKAGELRESVQQINHQLDVTKRVYTESRPFYSERIFMTCRNYIEQVELLMWGIRLGSGLISTGYMPSDPTKAEFSQPDKEMHIIVYNRVEEIVSAIRRRIAALEISSR